MRKTEFFVILDHFLPFYLLNNPKNQNIEKMKKLLEDIIILHMCNINYNHMMYGPWDTEHDRENFLSFWTIFCTFSLLTHPKNKKFEKMKKKPRDMIILHMCTIDDSHMMYGSWDMECNRHNFLSFWTVFCPFTPLTTQKNKILTKMEKTTQRYYHFTQVYYKWQSYDVLFPRYEVWQIEFFISDLFLLFYPPNNPKK